MERLHAEHEQVVSSPKWVWTFLKKKYACLYDVCPVNPKFDALKSRWLDYLKLHKLSKEKVWFYCNPPYERGSIEQWLEKAIKELKKDGVRTVFLIPSATQTVRFHEQVMPYAKSIIFIQQYISFQGYEGRNPHAMMFVEIDKRPEHWTYPDISCMEQS